MRRGCRYFKIDEVTGFICGGEPQDHECNEDMVILLLSNGERVEDNEENRKKYYDSVSGGSVACSICGRAAIDNSPYI